MGGRGASFGGGGGSPSYVSLWEREKVNLMHTSAAYFRREIAKIKEQRSK